MLKVYTKKVCPNCEKLKHHLTRHSVPYEAIDIEENEEAMAHIVGLGIRQVPVAELGNTRVPGFAPFDPKFREIMAKAKEAA